MTTCTGGGEQRLAQVVRVDETHIASLAEFIRAAWDPAATPEQVLRARAAAAATNPVRAGEGIPTFLFLAHGRAVGHVTTLPILLWRRGAERPAHWLKGLMVLPEYRNGPVGFLVLREALRHLQTAMALVVQPAARRLFQALGFTDLGVLPNCVLVLRPATLLRQLDPATLDLAGLPAWLPVALRLGRGLRASRVAGAVVSAALWLWRVGSGSRGFDVKTGESLDAEECDALWRQVRGGLAAAPSRDGPYLHSRYAGGSGGGYVCVTARERSTLVAVALLRRPRTDADPRLRGIRVATVSELLFPPRRADAGLAVLAGVEGAARALGADALLCSAAHYSIAPLLRRRGFWNVGGNVHFLVRAVADGQPLPRTLSEWWLTRGDSEADEVF